MRISVIIPAYNAAAYIERALQSILNQTRAADEILVINDGSTDNTADILRRYESRIRIIEQANAGVSAARNTGIRSANGDWIAFLDADDEWLPEKLAKQCQFHQAHPEIKWSSANYYRCDCGNKHKRFADFCIRPEDKIFGGDCFDDYLQAFEAMAKGHTDTMLIRRDVLLEAGLFFEPQKNIEDDDLWLRLGYMNLRFGFIREPLSVYHLGTEQSITKNHIQPQWIDLFLSRHIALAQQAGKAESFHRCAAGMLGFWIHKLLLGGRGGDVRYLLKRYARFLTPWCRLTSYAGSWCPKLWRWNERRKHPEAE
jgi:glycosyltransferase involved in cell wall biosynthesis